MGKLTSKSIHAAFAGALLAGSGSTAVAADLSSLDRGVGGDERTAMVSYTLPFGGKATEPDEPSFALTVAKGGNAKGLDARINTRFENDSLFINGTNVKHMTDQLNAGAEGAGYMPLIAVGVVVGAALLVANQDDDDQPSPKPEGGSGGGSDNDGGGI